MGSPAGRQGLRAWHTRAAWATMPGWLVMTAAPSCGGWSCCPFWTGPGPRGRSDGCPLSPPLLPRPPSGSGTGPPAAGDGPWQRGQALLASGWWRGALVRKRRPGRGAKEHRAAKGPVARAWRTGAGYRRNGNIHGPPAIVEHPGRPWVLTTDGLRGTVGPAPPAAADCARDRRRSPARRVLRPAGAPGRGAAQAEDRRRLSPGRGRSGSPAAGGIG